MRLSTADCRFERKTTGADFDLFDSALPAIGVQPEEFEFEFHWPGIILDEKMLSKVEKLIRYDVEWEGAEVKIERRRYGDPEIYQVEYEAFIWRPTGVASRRAQGMRSTPVQVLRSAPQAASTQL